MIKHVCVCTDVAVKFPTGSSSQWIYSYDVFQSNIREIAVTVNKIEREEYFKIHGLSQL